ncbi:hypothetical protein D3C87_1855080 [compost metagenome]
MSTFDCEVRWQKANWSKAKLIFDLLDNLNDFPSAEDFLNDPITNIYDHNPETGYWKNHTIGLVGTRVTFEIPI